MKGLSFLYKSKIRIAVLIIMLIITVVVVVVINLNSPAQGTITQNDYDNQSTIINSTPKKYSDEYISFSYPGGYTAVQGQKSSGIIDAVDLTTRQGRVIYVSIGVMKESLDTDTGVSFRRQHPDLYRLVSSDKNSIVFSKTDGQEYTGFIQHDDMVASISFTSVARQDMTADYETIANSLKWAR